MSQQMPSHTVHIYCRDTLAITLHILYNQTTINTMPMLNWGITYAAVRLGVELANGEVWFDDVAFGYQKLGCL